MIRPLTDRVVVRRDDAEEKTASGLYIPGTGQEKPTRGTVVAVGLGPLLPDGDSRQARDVKVGDRVLFTKYTGTEVMVEEQKLVIMQYGDLLCVVE
jgi:chaperonin GroES